MDDVSVRVDEHQKRPAAAAVDDLKGQVRVHQEDGVEPVVLLEVQGRSFVVARDHAQDLNPRFLILGR